MTSKVLTRASAPVLVYRQFHLGDGNGAHPHPDRRTAASPYAEHAGPAPDSGDQSVASLFADLEQADMTRDLDEFRALEVARDRLKGGEYGICIECGSDIGFDRLKASPAAIRCIQCQERREKTYGGEPKPSL